MPNYVVDAVKAISAYGAGHHPLTHLVIGRCTSKRSNSDKSSHHHRAQRKCNLCFARALSRGVYCNGGARVQNGPRDRGKDAT